MPQTAVRCGRGGRTLETAFLSPRKVGVALVDTQPLRGPNPTMSNPKEDRTMTNPTCPDCKKTFPGSNNAGHCRSCHRTFIGLKSFDAHRMGAFPDGRHCDLVPYELPSPSGKTRYGHWADDHGFFHHGRKLTAEDIAAFGWVRVGKVPPGSTQTEQNPV